MRGIELTPEHPITKLVSLSETAETAGFDTVFSSCHYNNRDPFIALDRIAAATSLYIGPGVSNPYLTHPIALASTLATLTEVTDGRVIFGLGAGDRSTLQTLGIDRESPLERVRETIEITREVLDGNTISHDGTFSSAEARLNYSVPYDLPIYVGAQGPQMLRMSAQYADGILVNASHERDFEWATNEIKQGLEHRDRSSAPDIVAFTSVSIAPSSDAAIEAARPPVAFITGGAPDHVLDRHNIPHDKAHHVGKLIAESRFSDAFDAVTDDMLEAFSITGTPVTVADDLANIAQYVDSIVTAAPLGPDLKEAVPLLGDVLTQIHDI